MSGPTEEEMISAMSRTIGGEAPPKPAVQEAPQDPSQLRSIVDRIVRLEEEKKGLSSDIKDIYTEAQSAGYSKKALRIVVRREMEDADQRAAREDAEQMAAAMIAALGDFASSPLGDAAVRHAKH